MTQFQTNTNNLQKNTPITAVTSSSYTALLTDYIIDVNFAGAVTITLPAPSTTGATVNVGKIWIIKDISGNAVTNNITLLPASGTIDGQVSLKITGNYGYYAVTTNGTNYFTIAANSAASSTPSINTQIFTLSGTYTPSANLGYCVIECLGGGGGSGGIANVPSNANAVAVPGAGAGAYSRSVFMPVTIGASQVVTIGAGGTAAVGAGGNGGTTSVGALITAPGGNGSSSPIPASFGAAQGASAAATGTGQLATTGAGGGASFWQVISAGLSYLAVGGAGGASHFGGAGISGATASGSTVVTANLGLSYGNGASGGVATGTSGGAVSGRVGQGGIVVITEYIFTPVASQVGSAVTWSSVAGTTQAMQQQMGYYTTSGSATTLTLPTTAVVGSMMAVLGTGAGLWTIAQNAGQSIQYGTQISTVGTGGSLKSSNVGDEIWLLCTTANTGWFAFNSQGNILTS